MVRIPGRKRSLWRHGINVKMILKYVCGQDASGSLVSSDERSDEPSDSMKGVEFLS